MPFSSHSTIEAHILMHKNSKLDNTTWKIVMNQTNDEHYNKPFTKDWIKVA